MIHTCDRSSRWHTPCLQINLNKCIAWSFVCVLWGERSLVLVTWSRRSLQPVPVHGLCPRPVTQPPDVTANGDWLIPEIAENIYIYLLFFIAFRHLLLPLLCCGDSIIILQNKVKLFRKPNRTGHGGGGQNRRRLWLCFTGRGGLVPQRGLRVQNMLQLLRPGTTHSQNTGLFTHLLPGVPRRAALPGR